MSGGTWSLSYGPLATVEVTAGGVTWAAVDGSTVDSVYVEHATTSDGDATVGSATLSQGGGAGTIPADGSFDPATAFQAVRLAFQPAPVPVGAFASARAVASLPWVLRRGLAESAVRGV
jgi:hypothetical protein